MEEDGIKIGVRLDTSELNNDAQQASQIVTDGLSGMSDKIDKTGLDLRKMLTNLPKVNVEVVTNAGQTLKTIDQGFKEIDRVVGENKSAIKELEGVYKELKQTASEKFMSGHDKEFNEIERVAEAIQRNIDKRKELIAEAEMMADELAKTEQKLQEEAQSAQQSEERHVSLKQAIRELQEAMANYVMEHGTDQTEEYRKMADELGRLRDIRGDIQAQGSILANDEATIAGVISGVQGLTGAFAVAQGAVGMFTSENEKLNKIMLKVQSIMSIVMGLQQVQQVLNKDSAFQLTVVNGLKEWWTKISNEARGVQIAETVATEADNVAKEANAIATGVETVAKEAQTVAQGENTVATEVNTVATVANTVAEEAGAVAGWSLASAFRAVGLAIKSIPGIGWLLAAIGALIGLITSFTDEEEENTQSIEANTEALKRQKTAHEEVQDSVSSVSASVGSLEAQYRLLQTRWNMLKTEQQKIQFIHDQRSAFNSLGVSINTVAQAQQFLVKQAPAVIRALQAVAEAAAYGKLYQEAIEKRGRALMEFDLAPLTRENGGFYTTVKPDNITQFEREKWLKPSQYRITTSATGELKYEYDTDVYGIIDERRRQEARDRRAGLRKNIEEEYGREVKYLEGIYIQKQADADNARNTLKGLGIDINSDNVNVSALRAGANRATGGGGRGGHGGGGGNNNDDDKQEEKNKQKLADELARKQALIDQYKQSIQYMTDDELKLRQELINSKVDGYEKDYEQLWLNYDKLIFENQSREKKMLEDLRTNKLREYEIKNPEATEQQKIDYAKSLELSRKDLSQAQQEILQGYDAIINDYWTNVNTKMLSKAIDDYLSYEEERLKIAEKYAKRREYLYEWEDKKDENGNVTGIQIKRDENGNPVLREGVTQDNLAQIQKAEDEAYQKLEEELAQKNEAYQNWCEQITTITLWQLQNLLEEAKKALEIAEKESGGKITEQVVIARQKVKKLEDEISKKKGTNNLSPDKRSMKDWSTMYKVLGEVAKTFEEIGQNCKGAVGEFISAVGKMATSTMTIINSVVQFGEISIQGIEASSEAAARSIATVEKASVILTIISAALQIAMKIASLFNNDDDKQKEIEKLQERIDQLQWELDNQDIVRMQEREGLAIERVKEAVTETTESLKEQFEEIKRINGVLEKQKALTEYNAEVMRQSVVKLADAYANMSYTADKALGAEKFENSRKMLENYAEQQLLIQEQIDKEREKKDTDNSKIIDWQNKIEELGHSALEVINEMIEEIIGGTSSEIANELADAFYEAFEAGEDAAKAWGDKVDEIVKDVLKRMMVQKFLEEPLGEIFNTYKSRWFKDGQFQGIDAVIASMNDFRSDLYGTYDVFSKVMDSLPEDLVQMFTDTDKSREAQQKGIAQASQDSVDELNGRMTAIQGHTYAICEYTKQMNETSADILRSVMNIESETSGFNQRLQRMESNLRGVREAVDDIALHGIKVQ